MSLRKSNRFSNPGVLTDDTEVSGITVKDWNAALTGGMAETLAELKQRASAVPKRDVSTARSFDLASAVKKTLEYSR